MVTGSFVALITPMNADYSIDYMGFEDLMTFQRQYGTSALLIMGSSGEVSMLSESERHAIVRETVKHKTDDMQLWYGCTGRSTDTTIAFVRQAADAGADGAIVAAPSYICGSNADIMKFFLEVADASPIPIGIYNNPPRVKTDLSVADVLNLARHPMIAVLKESTPRVGQVGLVCSAQPDVAVMCCCSPNLGLIVPTMALGGHGTANMTGNIIPAEMARISTPWGNNAGAGQAFREAYLRNLPMLHFAYSAVNPVPVKSLMGAVGLPAGPLRRPLQPLDPAALAEGLRIVRNLGLDKKYGFRVQEKAAAAE